jgi:DNA repair protein RadC
MLRPAEREQTRTPRAAAAYFMAALRERDQEEFYTIVLNIKNHVLCVHIVYKGSVNTAAIRLGEVFKEALKLNAVGIICTHNPSQFGGRPQP